MVDRKQNPETARTRQTFRVEKIQRMVHLRNYRAWWVTLQGRGCRFCVVLDGKYLPPNGIPPPGRLIHVAFGYTRLGNSQGLWALKAFDFLKADKGTKR